MEVGGRAGTDTEQNVRLEEEIGVQRKHDQVPWTREMTRGELLKNFRSLTESSVDALFDILDMFPKQGCH